MNKITADKIILRHECEAEYQEITRLVRESFLYGTQYSDGDAEVKLIEEIRAGRFYRPELSFTAWLDDELVGHFMLSDLPLASEGRCGEWENSCTNGVLMLSPVSVVHTKLRMGIGSAMLTLGIERAKQSGAKAILVEGNPQFYNTLGFETSRKFGVFPCDDNDFLHENPQCLMFMEMQKGWSDAEKVFVDYSMYPSISSPESQ